MKKSFSLKSAIYFLIFLLPLLPSQLEIFSVPVYKVLILGITILILISEKRIYINKIFVRHMLFFIILMSIPLLYNMCFKQIFFLFLEIVFPICIGYCVINNENEIQKLLMVLISSATILSVLAIIEAFTSLNLLCSIWGIEVDRNTANGYRLGIARACSTFSTSIDFCVYLNIILIIVLYLILNTKKKSLIPIYILITIACFLTVSRAPILLGIIVQVYILTKSNLLSKRIFYYVFLGLMILLCGLSVFGIINYSLIIQVIVSGIGVIINPSKFSAISSQFGMGGASERIKLFTWVIDAIRGNMLFGVGEKGFSVSISQWKTKSSIENYYLALLHMAGIVGVVGYIYFIINILKKMKPQKLLRFSRQDINSYTFFIFAVALFFFFSNLTVSYRSEGVFFYMLIGTGYAVLYKIKNV